jgi:hypothetical protein
VNRKYDDIEIWIGTCFSVRSQERHLIRLSSCEPEELNQHNYEPKPTTINPLHLGAAFTCAASADTGGRDVLVMSCRVSRGLRGEEGARSRPLFCKGEVVEEADPASWTMVETLMKHQLSEDTELRMYHTQNLIHSYWLPRGWEKPQNLFCVNDQLLPCGTTY